MVKYFELLIFQIMYEKVNLLGLRSCRESKRLNFFDIFKSYLVYYRENIVYFK